MVITGKQYGFPKSETYTNFLTERIPSTNDERNSIKIMFSKK